LLDRQILIFDEPTSHLDAETEKCVVEYLKRALTGRTAVFVTHRPMIEELCNRTYVFQDRKLLLKK
jgi:ABC-type bacteriocin/lantibiotic exporter with double-glycine peptidase domain